MKTLEWRTFILAGILDCILKGHKIVTVYVVNRTIILYCKPPNTAHPGYLCHATPKAILPPVQMKLHIRLIETVSKALATKDLPETPPEMKGLEKS